MHRQEVREITQLEAALLQGTGWRAPSRKFYPAAFARRAAAGFGVVRERNVAT
jgi:hypothetical protein